MLQRPEQELRVSCLPPPGEKEDLKIEVAGEIHLPNAGQFRDMLQPLLSSHDGCVLLDFRQVVFLDSAGLKTVLDTRKQLSLQSRALTLLLRPESQPDRVLRTSRLETIMTLLYE